MALQIEKGIPVSPAGGEKATTELYHILNAMSVGDSVLVPDKTQNQVSSQVALRGRKNNFRYVTRNVEGGIRVWRVK